MGIPELREIENWKLEARLEDNQRYFFHLKDVEKILDAKKCYVIGRKGSGKTAISEYLNNQNSYNIFAKKLSFKNFPFNEIYPLSNSNFTRPNQYMTFWLYVLYTAVCQMMAENEAVNPEIRGKIAAIFPNDISRALAKNVSQINSGKLGISILGTGGSIDLSKGQKSNDSTWIERITILEDVILKYIDGAKYFILFDELDEDYKQMLNEEKNIEYTDLLTSLFKAVQHVRSVIYSNNIQVIPIIFLRDDIYSLLRDPDKNKWSDLKIELDWNPKTIRPLLAFRISRAVAANGEVLEFGRAWNTIFTPAPVPMGFHRGKLMDTFEYITRSTFWRPRDYIKYMQACAEVSLRGGSELITTETIKEVDKSFSNYLREEIIDEIHGILPEIDAILGIISTIRKQTFSLSDFKNAYKHLIERKEVPNREAEFILQLLFHFSVIGNQTRQKSFLVFRYENKEARINFGENFVVHRGLHKALQIV